LRDEVRELREEGPAESTDSGGGPGPRGVRGRRMARWTGAIVLLVLAGLLAPVSVVARYARDQVLNTDRYVATMAPLAKDPAIQNDVADQITNQIFTYLDVQALTTQSLQALAKLGVPERVVGLSEPIANGIEQFVGTQVHKLVASDQFAAVWEQANRIAHAQLVSALTGREGGAVTVANGKVTVDLGPLITQVKQQLVSEGFGLASRIPTVSTSFTVLESPNIEKAQRGVRLLDQAANWLPVIVLVLLLLGVALAPNRRRGLLVGALAVAAGMLVLAIGIAIGRHWYITTRPAGILSEDAATSLIDTVISPMRTALRAVLLLALLVAAAAFVLGPAASAVAIRRGTTRGFAALRERTAGDRPPNKVEAWIGANRTPLRIAVVALGLLVYVFWSYPSGGVVLGIAIAVLLALAIVEFAGRTPRAATARPAD
jgi:hypothetical protein